MNEDFSWGSDRLRTGVDGSRSFSDDELLICDRMMPGFSLSKKRWCYFRVDCIEDVELNSTAFDRLFMAEDQKMMIYSLVQVHTNQTSDFDDVIKGKGKGMVFLLHGVTGVGKTLTAGNFGSVTCMAFVLKVLQRVWLTLHGNLFILSVAVNLGYNRNWLKSACRLCFI